MTKAITLWLSVCLLWAGTGPVVWAVMGPHQTPAPAQATPTMAPTQPATTPAAYPAPDAGTADASGAYFAGLIIWGVIIVVVAVTAFLVWRTRPHR